MSTAAAWLRVVLYELRDVAFDHYATVLEIMQANITYYSSVLSKQPGFETGYWASDLEDGLVAAVTTWQSMEAIEHAQPTLERLAADAEVHGIHRTHVQNLQLFCEPALAADVPADSWLRLVSYQARPNSPGANGYMFDHVAESRRILAEQPGFLRGCWGRDLDTRTLTAVTHWGSRRAIAAARPALQQLQVAAVAEGLHPLETHHLHLFAAAHAPRRPAAAH